MHAIKRLPRLGDFGWDQVYQVDCLDAMRAFPDDYFDLVITDPPYGIDVGETGKWGWEGAAKNQDYGSADWDNKPMSLDQFKEIQRISKNQIIFGGNYFTNILPPSSCWVVWDKDNQGSPFADCELIWASFEKTVRIVKWRWYGMLQEHGGHFKEKRYHITQKPLGVMRWIIEKYCKTGDTILDPFCGSGSTLVAARELGHQFMGFDLVEHYVDIARMRLAMATGAGRDERIGSGLPLTFEDLVESG